MTLDFLSEWAVKIAREVTPQEIDQAPYVAAHFVRGGRHRKNLFKERAGSEAGGSGLSDFATFFPHVLNAIQIAAPFIYGVLASGAISSSIDLVKLVKDVHDALRKKRQQATPAQPGIGSIQINQVNISIEQSIVVMSQTMHAAGLNAEESERNSAKIMFVFASDPQGAKIFLDKLMEKKS